MRGKRNPEVRRPMDRCERGNWIDTEGHISTDAIEITQKEREPLQDYCAGAEKDGVKCVVKPEKAGWSKAYITGYENIANEIVLTKHCIRTKTKHTQIERFKKHLQTPRLRREYEAERALKTLLENPYKKRRRKKTT